MYIDQTLNTLKAEIDTYECKECIWVEIRGKGNANLTVGCVYRSPNSNDENNTMMNKMVQNLNCSKKLLMMGDFNYGEIKWKDEDEIHATEAKAEAFLESTRDAFLYQHIQEPTRHRGTQKRNILDLVFTTDDSVDNIRYDSPLGNSDHCCIIFDIEVNCEQKRKPKSYPNYIKANYSQMKEDIQNTNWELALEDKDTEEAWIFFKELLEETCKRNIPVFTPKEGNKRPLWMNTTA